MEIYKTNGVCAKEIGVEIEDGILRKVNFSGAVMEIQKPLKYC